MPLPPAVPPLDEPYAAALEEALAFIRAHVPAISGIIAAGTIIAGHPDPHSDLDLYVINRAPRRQRVQRWYNDVPAEIFINPASAIRGYLAAESRRGRPSTAHMLVHGVVIQDNDAEIGALRTEAREILARGPQRDHERLTMLRYAAATAFEDARDALTRDEATADLILHGAVHQMLHYVFWAAGRWLPRDKDLLDALAEVDHISAALARVYYATTGYPERLTIATEIADRTIAARGFFAWDGTPEDLV